MATVAVSELEEILTDPISPRNDLILDSGCSEHMLIRRGSSQTLSGIMLVRNL